VGCLLGSIEHGAIFNRTIKHGRPEASQLSARTQGSHKVAGGGQHNNRITFRAIRLSIVRPAVLPKASALHAAQEQRRRSSLRN
jgi:hypothetical protein